MAALDAVQSQSSPKGVAVVVTPAGSASVTVMLAGCDSATSSTDGVSV
ncbi:unannotated protein [freshwater metagenome]|uniref:Unannotated protein n=1 Tax=freshwater metagenome TaxID=449393 RepID=A0A6J6PHG6_9ZZZZ